MPGPNFVTGWTSASLAPKTSLPSSLNSRPVPTTPAPATGTPSAVSNGVLSNPSAVATAINNANGQQTGIATLRDAALGSRDPLQSLGLGKTGISSSTYAHPDAPAFLADAINNLNGSAGFAQSNLTNLLLQQILQNNQSLMDTHETAAAHQEAQDKAMIAQAKAVAAANDHATQLRLHALQGGMTLPTPIGTGAQSAIPISNSPWNAPNPSGWTSAYPPAISPQGGVLGVGWAPGTVNGMY